MDGNLQKKTQYCDFCDEELIFDEVSPWQAPNEASDLFFKSLKIGRFRGIVSIIMCKKSGPDQNSRYMPLALELIKRDVLVITAGCAAEELGKAGLTEPETFRWAGDGLAEFCEHLNIQPVLSVGSSMDNPEIFEFYKVLASKTFADITDLPMAVITPEQDQTDISTEAALLNLRDIYGSVFSMEEDPVKTADLVDDCLHAKRLELSWYDRYNCDVFS